MAKASEGARVCRTLLIMAVAAMVVPLVLPGCERATQGPATTDDGRVPPAPVPATTGESATAQEDPATTAEGSATTGESATAQEDPATTAEGPATGGETISYGEEVNLADHVVAGKITIFDFYSEYCPPCLMISPKLEELAGRRDDIAVVKVDINRPGMRGIDWQSPVARQHSLRSIPHFIIYGTNGQVMVEGREAYQRVNEWLRR